jgi:hypothetical protein
VSQNWRGGGPRVRFGDERKPIVDRPPVLHSAEYDEFCWCGDQHYESESGHKRAGLHPWGPLDPEEKE